MSKKLTRSRAIRAKCLDCSGYQPKEVRYCPIKNCPLFRYRMGRELKDNSKKSEDSS